MSDGWFYALGAFWVGGIAATVLYVELVENRKTRNLDPVDGVMRRETR